MIETSQIHIFHTIVETGSFTRAAEALNCVQSNITAHIKQLEHQMGGKLFERGRHGAKLTPLGARFEEHAAQVLTLLDEVERDMLDQSGTCAPLRLGAMETTAATRLPALFKKLHQHFPDAELSLLTGTTQELLIAVEDRKIDAAFVSAQLDPDRFAAVAAFKEEMVVVSPAAGACKSKRAPGAQDRMIASRPLIAFRNGCSYRLVAEDWLRSRQHAPFSVIEMGSIDGILGCVAAGMGIAVAPREMIKQSVYYKELDVQRLPAPFATCQTYLVRRHDHRSSLALRQLMEWMKPGPGRKKNQRTA